MEIFQKNKLKFLALAFAGIVGFSVFGLSEDVIAQTGGCEVIDADFRSGASYPEDAFTYPNNRPFVYVDVETENCIGQNIRITIRNQVGFDNAESLGFGQSGSEEAADINVADETPILVSENNFTLAYVATEESCYSNLSLGWFAGNWNLYGWDCAYFIMLEDSTGWSVYENEYGENYTENSALQYDCTDGIVGIFCPADPLDWAFHGIHPFGYISPEDQFNYTPPNLSYQGADFYLAPLPGFSGQGECQNPPCSKLGEFLRGFFTVLIVIAGILAFIMIVIGGITWATSDAIGGKSEGKQMIENAVLGLVLALGGWIVLNTINPNLASNLGITVPVVTLEGDTDIFGTTFTSGTTAFSLPNNLGLYCPQSGGSGAVPQIIDSFVGKVTYRFGGKGGALPVGQSFTSSNGNSSMCTNDSGTQQQCGSFCPANSVCLDCSGFVNHVRKCSGLNIYGGTASMVSHDHAKPVSMNTLSANGQSLTVEGQTYQLQPGDILVWNGHVVIYYGDGKIAESRGSSDGLIANSNIVKTPLTQYSHKNKITHIIKINP